MKLNQEKCHLLVCGHKHQNFWARIGEMKIWESRKQKLLAVEIVVQTLIYMFRRYVKKLEKSCLYEHNCLIL